MDNVDKTLDNVYNTSFPVDNHYKSFLYYSFPIISAHDLWISFWNTKDVLCFYALVYLENNEDILTWGLSVNEYQATALG